ncbi:MAG TPA: hypothetical protein VIW01_05025 [Dehalococcoidia bacterium]
MSSRARATAIGLLGPAISLTGLVWIVLGALFDPTPEAADFRYFLFDSPHLMIAVGVLVSIVCVPILVQVARAEPEELELPDFEAVYGAQALEEDEATAADERGGSYQWSPK